MPDRSGQSWSVADELRLADLAEAGHSAKDIARALGRSTVAVQLHAGLLDVTISGFRLGAGRQRGRGGMSPA